MWINTNYYSLPAGRKAYSKHNISIDDYYFQAILPELTSSQPACADAVRQGGKGGIVETFPLIDELSETAALG
ncbi:MAG: hypothetical protein IIA61_00425 [Candidatus Marinimicrobia bacterium]|nr:hypothetical protein [Candidatus Neomarinimicrobiota bacterium]